MRIIHLNKEGGEYLCSNVLVEAWLEKGGIKIPCHSQEDFLYNYNLSEKHNLIIYEADF